MTWAIKWRGGLQGRYRLGLRSVPPHVAGYKTMCFDTRREARDAARQIWRSLEGRPDLRGAPHFWRSPKVVKVAVSVREIA